MLMKLCFLTYIAIYLLAFFIENAVSLHSPRCKVLVNTDAGPVCGRVLLAEDGSKYYSFRGIPYAKPPLGHRRFQIPESPTPWREPLYATIEGPACPQRNTVYGHIPVEVNGQSEDCLYVNIFIPATANLNKKETDHTNCPGLPILLHIPGGGFFCGSGNTDIHGPEYLMPKNVILVTFNYRINVFGFMCFNSDKIACNRGLWDMVAVVKWVNRNARAFGGNPNDVTLMGHSTGASAAHLLSLTDHVQGLFNRLILKSGTGIPVFYTTSPKYAADLANLFFQYVGINSTNSDYILQRLTEMPLTEIMEANDYVQYQTGILSFAPVLEDEKPGIPKFFKEDPLPLIEKGNGKDLPTLVTFTNNEMAFFRWPLMIVDIVDRLIATPELIISPRLRYSLSKTEQKEAADKIFQKYFNGKVTFEKVLTYYSNFFYKYPAFKLGEWQTAMGGAPVYISQFSYYSIFNPLKHGLWDNNTGASHMEDITYIFRNNAVLNKYLHLPPREKDNQMVEWMTTIITNFMRCSNPTCLKDKVSPWQPIRRDNTSYQDIGAPMVYKTMELTEEEQNLFQLFDSIDPDLRNLSLRLNKNRSG